ncbi:MAG: heme peroxidase family protein [Cyanobacteria bacterium P01_C01_bin.118]
MKHGQESYFIRNDGWIIGSLIPLDALRRIFKKFVPWYRNPVTDPVDPKPDDQPKLPRRVFCRLFDEGTQPDAEGLIELGLAMETEVVPATPGQTSALTDISKEISSSGDSNIPGGFTYLGQFIDHDITSDPTPLTQDGPAVVPKKIDNQRTPALDLDCLYANGPSQNPELFEADGVHMKVGTNDATPEFAPGGPIPSFNNDLPRRPDMKAIIGDGRNDENLAVAQTHLAFIKFHNKKVNELKAAQPSLQGEALFKAAQKEVVLHYQSIILNDFLPRIVQEDVLQDVLCNGRKLYTEELKECMPIEFSVAAYRLGHSMVRPSYEWNRVFNTKRDGITATMEFLFEFSEVSGSRGDGDDPFFGSPTVPSNWIIDWTRFYDFADVDGVDPHPDMNFTREIDAKLSFALQQLPEFQKQNLPAIFISLASRNLLRGRLVKLPSGQAVVKGMQDKGISVTGLTTDDLLTSPHGEILKTHGFDQETPLWYYILREAKVKNDGNKLGPVGSRIVAEVFVGLIENSAISLRAQSDISDPQFSMSKLLAFVGELNPLG